MNARAALIEQTRTLLRARRVADAEQLLLRELASDNRDGDLLELMAEFYLEVRRPTDAVKVLTWWTEADPQRIGAYLMLADAFVQLDQIADVLAVYTRLSTVHPELAMAHFNRAYYLRRLGRLEEAVAAYRRAIDLGVENPAEAWSNIGIILGEIERHDEARRAFSTALAADPRWIPALYNFGLLHEEFGERESALNVYQQVLAIDPLYHDALARIVHAQIIETPTDELLGRVSAALSRDDLTPGAREALLFAQGKALDECGEYDAAFAAYQQANSVARTRTKAYDRALIERDSQNIRNTFSARWIADAAPASDRAPVFVCGMFRSGTTLIEQMLGAHPALTPGGEIGYFNAALGDESAGYATVVAAAGDAGLRSLALGYLDYLDQRFPASTRVIDKRPDNFRFLGLLRGLFPAARFIIMQRHPLDTCLSIYFQQLGAGLRYASDLEDTAHYIASYRSLMEHWKALFPERILEVRYERLVEQPEVELRRVCDFLGLPWDPAVLSTPTNVSRVRTASTWQVRSPLHSDSIGRWRHYATQLGSIVNSWPEAESDDH